MKIVKAVLIASMILLVIPESASADKSYKSHKGAVRLNGNKVRDTATIGTINSFDVAIKTNNVERMRVDTMGNVGIGTAMPVSRLHIESALGSPGTVFNLPAHPGIPPWGDIGYDHKAVLQWQGGEQKFGIWRNYFNAFEQDWAITYNAPWDYTNNQWLGRDSGDSRANIAAFMRFNVAEGDSGQNAFAINFAPPDLAGIPPDWNGASWYRFYDGRTFPRRCPRDSRFVVQQVCRLLFPCRLIPPSIRCVSIWFLMDWPGSSRSGIEIRMSTTRLLMLIPATLASVVSQARNWK